MKGCEGLGTGDGLNSEHKLAGRADWFVSKIFIYSYSYAFIHSFFLFSNFSFPLPYSLLHVCRMGYLREKIINDDSLGTNVTQDRHYHRDQANKF